MAADPLVRAHSASAEATEAFGEALGRALVPGALVALAGELGSGKTTLVRGLARGLGVKERVVSPTFTRMRALEGRLPLFHFDAWRGGDEALFASGGEFLSGEGVGVVEWADRVAQHLPAPRIEVALRHAAGGRELAAAVVPAPEGSGAHAHALEAALRAALAGAAAALEIPGAP